MENIKDKLSTIAAILGAIAGCILLVGQQGVVLPGWINVVGIVFGSLSVTIIGILTGKLPNGKSKPPEIIANQNAEAEKADAKVVSPS